MVFLYLRGLETDLGKAEPRGQPQGSLVAGGGCLPQGIGGASPGPSCSSGANVGHQPWLSARRLSAALLLCWAAHEHLGQAQPWGQRDLLSQLTGLA